MRHQRILCGLLLLAAAAPVQAQATSALPARRFGITAGVNSSNISSDDGNDLSRKMGLVIGVLGVFPLGPNFSVQPELLYSMKGAKSDDEFGSGTIKMDYLQFPLLGRFDFTTTGSTKPFIYGGPAVALRTRCELTARETGGSDVSVDCKEFTSDVKKVDFGLVVGAGLAFDMTSYAFTIGARYDHSLTAFTSDGDPKHRVISVLLGLEFPWR